MKALAIFGRSREPVTYEVRLEIESASLGEFDDWLTDHVREMLAFPGFQSADIYRSLDITADNRVVRVVVYRVRSRRELDSYLRTHAARMRKEGVKRFGKQLAASRRVVPTAGFELPEGLSILHDNQAISGGLPICGNCHRPVEGRYCANCGQEDRTYLLSLAELVGEFLGEMTNFDSRFFRSMRPLLFRPGWLTLEYMRGRRQHYFPPIRMYIIISLLFFFFTAIVADNGLSNANFDNVVIGEETDDPEDRTETIRDLEQQLETATGFERQALQVAIDELRRQEERAVGGETDATTVPEGNTSDPSAVVDGDPENENRYGTEPAGSEADEAADDPPGFQVPSLELDDGVATASGWGGEELNRRMERGAEAIQENPRAFVKTLIDNIPSMMFIFLPLIALALKVLYLFSRRYYVEHLMFSLHVHSAVFMILLFWMLLGEIAEAWKPLDAVMGWINAIVWIYVPVYLYKSMRRVYGQGHFMTSMKFFLLIICYSVAASITSVFLLIAAIYQQA